MEFDFNTVMDMKYLRRLKRLLGASDRISLRLRNLAVSSFVLGTCSRWKARFKVFSGVFRITYEYYISVLINFSKTRSSATRLLRNICVNDEKKMCSSRHWVLLTWGWKQRTKKITSNTSFYGENSFFMLKCQSSRAKRNFKAKLLKSRAGRRRTRREFSEL